MAAHNDPMAIVGIGCRFPGADNLQEFWRVLIKGENHIMEIPRDRWNVDDHYSPDLDAPGKTYIKKAGFIHNYERFDNKLFGINESEAAQMDPQQRQVLECTFMALENAGITRQEIAGKNVGVFMGAMNNDFSLQMATNKHKVGNYTVSGTSASIISNRVSYVFHLTGPSMTIDTACSSSLVAIHQAANAIRTGDCDMAICGGVNMIIHPTTFIPLSKARMLSPTGQCHAFSANADGYARGEGCGIVILKPLSQAKKDNDNIWGTIATGLNQDGRAAQPITAPSGSQQKKLLEHVYKKYNIDPYTVDYIEAHGTGTKRGDPVEINSFGQFFTKDQTYKQRYLGSVKTNIGHLEPAAGVAGLIKVLLMMKHNTIVPSLHFDKPNEEIDLDKFHFVVPTKPLSWTSPYKVACLNSFGFGGANSHAVIIQYTKHTAEVVGQDVSYIVPFSGSTNETLLKSMQNFVNSQEDSYNLKTIALTSAIKREHFPVRKAFVANSKSDLIDQIHKCLTSQTLPNKISGGRKVIFVFCGMGTAWQGMCKDLLQKCKEFELQMKHIDTCLRRFVTWSLVERLQEGFSVDDPEFGPITIFACQIALAKLWAFWGVEPSLVVGQSIGEVAAAHIAGILSLDEAVRVIHHRTRVLKRARGGKMLMIRNLDTDDVEKLCVQYKGKANIALYYSPISCTVSGDADAIDDIKHEVQEFYSKKDQNILFSELRVSCAFHSHHVDECKQELDACLKDLQTQKPSVKMVSSVDSKTEMVDLMSPTYWGLNLRETVNFNQAIREAAVDRNLNIFLEIGPKPVLGAHIDDIFKNTVITALTVPSLVPNGSHDDLLQSLAILYQLNLPIDWASAFAEKDVPAPLPTHAFAQNTLPLLFGNGEQADAAPIHKSTKHLFVTKTQTDTKCNLNVSPSNLGTIYGHKIKGLVVLPGATYAEAGFGIIRVLNLGIPYNFSVSVKFFQPVTLKHGHPKNLNLDVLYPDDVLNKGGFSFVVHCGDTVHAKAKVTRNKNNVTEDRVDIQYIQLKCKDKVSREDVYNTLESSGLTYGDSFATVDYAFVGKGESLTKLKMSPGLKNEIENTVIHPAILDGMLQAAAAATGTKEREFLPIELKHVTVRGPVDDHMFVHSQIISETDSQSSLSLALLSSDGCILATVEEFTIKYIGTQQFDERSITFQQNMEPVGEIEHQRDMDSHAAIFTDMDFFTLRKGDFLLKERTYALGDINQNQSSNGTMLQDATQIFLIFPLTELSSYTGKSLQDELIERIMPLRQMILYVVSKGSSIPLRIVTEARESGNMTGSEAASLCLREAVKGFVRCVLREHRSLKIQLVDIFSEGEWDFKTNILSVLSNVSSDTLDKYPEVTYKKSVFYSHQILPLTVEAPLYRMSRLGSTSNAVLCSQSEIDILSPYFAPCDECTVVSKGKAVLEVFTSTIHSPVLHGITMKRKGVSESQSEADMHPLLSFETLGFMSSQLGHTVCYVSCFPNEVKRQIIVPKPCLIAKDAIPGYSPGLLTKLYLLWCICDASDMTSVAILYLPNTEKLADALSILLISRGSNSVSLLTPDEVKSLGKEHFATLIATIQLTHDVTQKLNHFMNFKKIICVDVITKRSAIEHLTKPGISVEMNIIRPIELFSSAAMLETVPRMLRWVKVQTRKTEHLANLFESNYWVHLPVHVQPINLTELLHTTEISFTKESGIDCNCMKTPRSQVFHKYGTYLVVGGLSGLGWECVSILAHRGAGCIVILSRSKPKPERIADMKFLATTFDCNVISMQVDITDFDEVDQMLRKLNELVPAQPIKGVFFGAAVLCDSSLLDMTVDTFRIVTSPKIVGSWNLHVILDNAPLDFFVMHSSIASVFGNDGQANYGAGNGFMDGLAICRQNSKQSGQSINWGPLHLGMLESNMHILKRLEARGLLSIDKKYIGQCLMHAVMLNEPQIIMCLFDEPKIVAQLRKNDEKALIARLWPYLGKAIKVSDERENGMLEQNISLDLDQLRRDSAETRKIEIMKYMSHIICDTALIDENLFKQDENLRDQGVDSMYALEISGQVLNDTQIKVSANELQFGTVDTLSDQIIEELFTSKSNHHISQERLIVSKETIISSITKPVLQRIESEMNACFVITVKLPDKADALNLRKMARELISRHMTARTLYKGFREEKSWEVLEADQALDFRVISTNKEGLLKKYISEPLDTNTKGPLRFLFAEKTSQLTIIIHRVAFDLNGITMMINEFLKFGEALTNGLSLDTVLRDPDLDSIEEIQKAVGHRFQHLKSFWKQRLPYIWYSSLTKSKTTKAERNDICVQRTFDEKMYKQMLKLSKEINLFPFHIMSSVFQLLLAFVSKRSASTVLVPVDLRAHIPALTRFVGRCTNCVPLIADVSDETMSVTDYFYSNTARTDSSVKNALLPFDEIQALMSDDQKVEVLRNFFIFHDDLLTLSERNKVSSVQAVAMGPHTESYMYVYHRKNIATIDVKLYLRKELFSKVWSEAVLQLYMDLLSYSLNHPTATLAQLREITQSEMEKTEKMGVFRKHKVASTCSPS